MILKQKKIGEYHDLMVEKGIRRGICHYIYGYLKANNKYMKDYVKIKNCHIFNIGM